MDIGPVSAIRPVPLIRPEPGAPDLSRVAETENRGQSGEDEYTPANRKASRGLEDEEADTAGEGSTETAASPIPYGTVNFFA